MQTILQAAGIIGIIVSIVWWVIEPGFDPLYAFITGLVAFLSSFVIPKQDDAGESLNQHNRRVMLNHVESFWIKGVLEKSLYGAALLELGIKEDTSAIQYPWTIKKEATDDILPAGMSILEIFEEIGAGRSLLILGAPGAGKTTMLLELARELIARARNAQVEPIPVVFNLASWTEKQTLAAWLADQLNIVYFVPKKTAPKWVNENRMILLLDGLDEVAQESRAKCVESINHFRNQYGLTSLIVCSRSREYQELNGKFSFEGAVTLQPLTPEQVNAYFDGFGERLVSIKQLLNKDRVLQELAQTPLMLSIMALAYKDKKTGDLSASKNKDDQRQHLFDVYINRMFERTTRTENSSFDKQKTLHYLSWLARKMIRHNIITYQIESMQPSWLDSELFERYYRIISNLCIELILILSFGAYGWLSYNLKLGLIYRLGGGPLFALGFGVIFGVVFGPLLGLVGRLDNEITMLDTLKVEWKKVGYGLMTGLLLGFLLGMITGLIIKDLVVGILGGLFTGLIIGSIAGGFLDAVSGSQVDEISHPGQHLRQSLINAGFIVVFCGIGFGLMPGVITGWLSVNLFYRLVLGLLFGLFSGILFGGGNLIQHYVLRFLLIRNKSLPKKLIPFLEHAVDLIFLRRVGGSYIFVHRLLMEHFAELDARSQT